jgi:hypothetical protein
MFPSQLSRLEYYKNEHPFSQLNDLNTAGLKIDQPIYNFNMGQVNQTPVVLQNKGFLPNRYLTVSGIDSNLIQGQSKVNNYIRNLGEYVNKNGYTHEFIPSIRVAK